MSSEIAIRAEGIGKRYRMGDRPPVLFDPGEDFGDTFVDFFFGYNF